MEENDIKKEYKKIMVGDVSDLSPADQYLFKAIVNKNAEEVKNAINDGADTRAANEEGKSAVELALGLKVDTVVKLVIEQDAKQYPDGKRSGLTNQLPFDENINKLIKQHEAVEAAKGIGKDLAESKHIPTSPTAKADVSRSSTPTTPTPTTPKTPQKKGSGMSI